MARTLHLSVSKQERIGGVTVMSKQAISVDGQDTVVREDTAKAFRGVHWALLSMAAFILIAAILFFGGFLKMATDGRPNTVAPQSERDAAR